MRTLKCSVRFSLDLSIADQLSPNGVVRNKKKPIGNPIEYIGNVEDIKTKICKEIDKIYEKLIEHYYSEE